MLFRSPTKRKQEYWSPLGEGPCTPSVAFFFCFVRTIPFISFSPSSCCFFCFVALLCHQSPLCSLLRFNLPPPFLPAAVLVLRNTHYATRTTQHYATNRFTRVFFTNIHVCFKKYKRKRIGLKPKWDGISEFLGYYPGWGYF